MGENVIQKIYKLLRKKNCFVENADVSSSNTYYKNVFITITLG